jgi:hypothetical protein
VNIKLYDQKDQSESWLKKRNAKAFYQPIVAPSVRQGTMALLQVCVNQRMFGVISIIFSA